MSLTKGRLDRAGKIHFHDASLSVWEEGIKGARDAGGWDGAKNWELQFKRDVFARIVQQLNRLGWTVGPQTYIFTGNNSRYCTKGDLQADLRLCGRTIEFTMFQNINAPDRPDHGGRYQYDQEKHMPYLLRIEMERTRRRIRDYLCNVFTGYEFEQPKPKLGFNGVTAMEYAAYSRRTSGHYVAELDRARIGNAGEDKSADGYQLENGTRVYAQTYDGRIVTGIAFYSLNGNWQIVTGRYGLIYAWNKQIWVESPGNLHIKRNADKRRKRIEREMRKAIAAMNFERAATLRDILFPGEQALFVVWHEEHKAYHGPGFSGYTSDKSEAGRFTSDELRGWERAPNKVIAIACAKEAA